MDRTRSLLSSRGRGLLRLSTRSACTLVIAAVAGCRGYPTPDGSGAVAPPAASGADAGSADGGGAPVDGTRTTCDDDSDWVAPVNPALDQGPIPWTSPTNLPFSCAPMPPAFFFEHPGADVPGVYARCASFDTGRAAAVAVSADASLVALVGRDGIVRMVEVASRTVVGVLAPPRASVGAAAFSPSGDTILTVAGGEREATLWQVGSWEPLWTVTLPGTPYLYAMPFVAFAPDGRTAVVSPGSDLMLIDAADGAILASRTTAQNAYVTALAYAWGGRRIVESEGTITGNCTGGGGGGDVNVLAPDSLVLVIDAFSLGGWGSTDPYLVPAFVASPTDDLVLTSGTYEDPSVHAFRVSDGVRLPPPALTALPVAFMPEGQSVLAFANNALQLIRLSDGTLLASTAADSSELPAVSADGATVMLASEGDRLLRAWKPADGVVTETCRGDHRDGSLAYVDLPSSLSRDGRVLALGWGDQVRLLDRSDGARLATIANVATGAASEPEVYAVSLSPDARYLMATWYGGYGQLATFRTMDGTRLPQPNRWTYWNEWTFDPDGRHLYAPSNGGMLAYDLDSGAPAAFLPAGGASLFAGISGGCPIAYHSYSLPIYLWRACATCDDPPFATEIDDQVPAVTAAGGAFVATPDGYDVGSTVTLWRMSGRPQPVRVFPSRPSHAPWGSRDFPVAVTPDGSRVVLGAQNPNQICYYGDPLYAVEVRDVASGDLLDSLPPQPSSIDDDALTFAYGGQLWCAR